MDGDVVLDEVGKIIGACLEELPGFFPGVSLGEWVLMPDHLHVVINIEETLSGTVDISGDGIAEATIPHGTQSGSLGAIIQCFKSISTRKVNQRGRTPGKQLWQRNYYEHIIQNEKELAEISLYIQENPRKDV